MKNRSHSNKQYKPINSDFYDELEAAATLNQMCEITFRDENGQEQQTISRIVDMYTEHGVEYAKLENQIIRLDSITSINGKTEDGGTVDTDTLQENTIADDISQTTSPSGENPLQQHDALGSPTPGDLHLHTGEQEMTHPQEVNSESNDENFVGDVGNIGNTGISQDRINTFTTQPIHDTAPMHQNDIVEDNLLGNTLPEENQAIAEQTVMFETAATEPVQPHKEGDFAHDFVTATTPVVLVENEYYNLTADRLRNRLYIKVLQSWDDVSDVTEMGIYLNKIAPLMIGPFTLLNDLTGLTPDENGTLESPAIPNKDVLLNAGLVKVADLVPYTCETLVHGIHSFSVNSLRLRYFKDRLQAEHWLTGDDVIGTDMKEGRGLG